MSFAFGLPFPQETGTPTTVRDSIRTLLGPKPHLNPILGSVGSGAPHDIERQKSELIAYRAKIVAVMNILEAGVKTAENGPITEAPVGKMSTPRKPILVARHANRCSSVVTERRYRR